jgi:hypothetical protein
MQDILMMMAYAAWILTAVLGIVWINRSRAKKRLRAALDAYAEKQIAQARLWKVKVGQQASRWTATAGNG